MHRILLSSMALSVFLVQCGAPAPVDGVGGQPQTAEPLASGQTGCTEAVRADRARHREVLRDVLGRQEGDLWDMPGVVGLGTGPAYEGDERTGELGIVVMLDPDIAPYQFDPDKIIPSELEGCLVSLQVAHGVPGLEHVRELFELASTDGRQPVEGRGKEISCTLGIRSHGKLHSKVLKDVVDRHGSLLWGVGSLSGLGVGIVRKDGEMTGELGISVLLETELTEEQKKRVPYSIEGCTVNLKKVGRFRSLVKPAE